MIRLLRSFAFAAVVLFVSSVNASAQAPVANFTSNITTGCSPIVVQFTDLSTNNPTTWAWDLGNGTTSAVQNPSTTYVIPGTYTVILTAGNASGSSVKTLVAYITANPTPTVAFAANDPSPGCAPKTVQFINTSNGNSTGVTTYYWDFGDGSTSTAQNPGHTYTTPGNYSVSLVATNGVGCNSVLTRTNYISVSARPTAAFNVSNGSSCTAPVNAVFNNTSTGATSYVWDFGDGGSSTATSPTHTYTVAGSYTVRLIAISAGGCRDTVIQPAAVNLGSLTAGFTSSAATACAGTSISFTNTSVPGAGNSTWYFGDGGTSTATNPSHTYNTSGTYTVKLVVNYTNCTDSVTRTIVINPKPTAQFVPTQGTGCYDVNFINSSTGGATYAWRFGDGGTSTAFSPTHTYAVAGNYTGVLIVTGTNGCMDSLGFPFTITPLSVSISGNTILGCAPAASALTATSNIAIPVAYSWNFGDGGTGTGPSGNHTYAAPGTYTVTLTGTTAGGCTATTTTTVTVGAHSVPNFTATPTTMCFGQPVTFNNTSTGATSYTWLFGDGGTSTVTNPVYTYDAPGTFSPTLITNNNGCRDTFRRANYIIVNPPKAVPVAAATCANHHLVTFTNNSIGATTSFWDLGDGTTYTGTTPPPHNYPVNGTYTITLTVTNAASGCTHVKTVTVNIYDAPAAFTAAPTTACVGSPISFTAQATPAANYASWRLDFGDGTFQQLTTPNFTHVYTTPGNYTARLIAFDAFGCSDTLTRTNYIHINGPTVAFTANTIVCPGLQTMFTDQSTTTSPSITSRTWTFGDGSFVTTTASSIAHTYATPGTYTVKLVVTDVNGCKDSLTKVNFIVINKPISAFTAGNVLGCLGKPVVFNNTSTGTPPLTYAWDFGDATTSAAASPSHIYNTVGTYNVRLIITDGNGCKDTLLRPAYINISQVTAGFTRSDTLGFCPPFSVNFTNTSTGATSYLWDFGNGNTSTAVSPNTVYTTAGTFTIVLRAFNANGCMDSMVRMVRVNPGPTGTISYGPVTGCLPLTVTFTSTTANATSLTWDFDNGITQNVTGNTVTYTYNQRGNFVPKLIVSNGNGCSVAIVGTDTIKVNKIDAGFRAVPNPVCAQSPVTFTDTSVANGLVIATRNWNFGDATTGTGAITTHAYTAAGTYTARLITGTASGCPDTAYRTVVVNPLPVINPGNNQTICAGTSAILQVTGGTSYAWSPGATLSCTTCSTPTATPLVTTTYTVTSTTAAGCSTTGQVTVTVNPLPVINAGADRSVCTGGSVTLNATGGSNYSWSPGTGLSCTFCASPVATPAATTTYIVTGTGVGGCTNTDTVTVNVGSLPAVSAGPNQFICTGGSATLAATGATGYVWSPAAGLSCTTCANPVATPAATTTYTVTGTNGTGCTGTATVTVTVNTVPVISVAGNRAVCAGDSTQLTASGAGTYAWSPAAGLSCTACANPYARPAATTTYTVTGTSGAGCTGTTTVTVTSNTLPTVSGGGPKTICAGDSTQLTATGAATYVWTPATGLSSATIANPYARPTVTTTYTVTGTSAQGCVNTATVLVTVNRKPNVTTSNAAICPGGSVALRADSAVSYLWSPATGLSCTACANPTASPTATTTYTVTGTGANGCTGTATATVTVNPLPVVTVTGNRNICRGISTQLTASGAGTYVWSPATGLSNPNIANPIANPATTTTYTVTGTSGVGCIATTTVTITVNTPPTVTTGPAQTACAGTPVTLAAAGAATYVWSPATGLSCTACPNPVATPNATTTYTVTGTDAAGCNGSATVTVTINPLSVVNAGADTTICGLTAAQLTATGAVSYVWTPAATLSCSTCANPVATPTATTTYTVVGTGANGCTASDAVTVSIYTQPPVNAGPDQTICAGQSAQLQASGATSYVWTPAATLTCTTCPNPVALPLANTTYVVTGTDIHGCVDSDQVAITLINRVPVGIEPGGDICAGESFQLNASGGSAYSWSPASTLSNSTIANPVATPTTTTTYRVIISQGSCFNDTLQATVTVHPIPTVNAGPDRNVLAGSSVTITPVVTDVATYSWSPAEGLNCTTCPAPVASPLKTTTYKVDVASEFGCTASDDITIFVTCDGKQLWMPNTFTPNADGQNDRFYPHGRGITMVRRFRIYDRWGELIYDVSNMPVDDASYGWDGTYKNQTLKPDVYVYIVNAECSTGEPVEIKGDISLLR